MNVPFFLEQRTPSTTRGLTSQAFAWLATIRRHAFALQLISAVVAYGLPLAASAEAPPHARSALPTVVHVHGAWTDGSSWNPVIAQLKMASRIRASTTHLRASHMPFLSKPWDTAAVILDAMNTVSGR